MTDCARSLPWIGIPAVHVPPLSERGKGVLVAVIDTGIDVLHEAFHSGNTSRILAIWDQRDSSGPTPASAKPGVYQQNYGTLHTRTDISSYILANAVGKNLGRDPNGHGTHVTSIAAGSPLVETKFPGGVAPEADIVFVIPKLGATPDDSISLGYSKTHMDALAFVRSTAEDAGLPVAVNVSLGMNAGAHDGTSPLELAFDLFSKGGSDPGYVIIKSAGNEFGEDGHSSVRAFEGGIAQIAWTTASVPRHEDYFEFWFHSSDELKFTLNAPDGTRCSVDRTHAKASNSYGSVSLHLSLVRFHPDNGDSCLVIAVRGSQNTSLTEPGNWHLEIEGKAVFSDGVVHGWVERDSARAVRFRTGNAEDMTLSIPGTARTVITVGACQPSVPLALSPSSSRGPTRDERLKPELVAPGVGIVAAKAGTANGVIAMTGTSMAAPHVTGAVALLLAHRLRKGKPQLNAMQIKKALSQFLKNFNGRWQEGFGYGGLDVTELLKELG
jgi:subtilisin family serine protease